MNFGLSVQPHALIMDMNEARRLFFEYDGSCFYMSRNGVEDQYRQAGVPPETESEWLKELTLIKLDLLSQKGNWSVLHFLKHHADHGHLNHVLHAEPKGALWERCAFLELMLDYARGCKKAGGDPSLVAQAIRKVIVESERLLRRARSESSIGRVRAIVTQAQRMLDEA